MGSASQSLWPLARSLFCELICSGYELLNHYCLDDGGDVAVASDMNFVQTDSQAQGSLILWAREAFARGPHKDSRPLALTRC